MPVDIELPAHISSELRVVVAKLVRRLRRENALPIAHLAVLGRLDRSGPQTTSALAISERMRPQSMAEMLKELAAEGLIERRPDPTDGRQILIELSQAGRTFVTSERNRHEGWLSQAISNELTPAEQDILAAAVSLLGRLAEL